ncbi:MAG: Na(+)-translocating NADH-quinone reductase subunit A [Rikenellaceae bacterium]
MSKVIRLKKGLDIKLVGSAEKVLNSAPLADVYAVCPTDFFGVTPKLLVQEGANVKAGTALFFDKNNPELIFTSPVSGVVKEIVRGEKRKILRVEITPSQTQEYETFEIGDLASSSREQIIETIQKAGLWSMFIQRPYGVIPQSTQEPKAIYVSAFDTAPIAGDVDFFMNNLDADFLKGVEVLKKLAPKVHIGVNPRNNFKALTQVSGVETTTFEGKHPAGNVGVQIHHTSPINKGETVWTIGMQEIAILGRLFTSGKVDMTKIVALAGSMVKRPQYYRIISGAKLDSIVNDKIDAESATPRFISGNPLTGKQTCKDGYISYYANQISVIPEGDYYEMLGWIAPRLEKMSVSRTYFSWLTPSKKYALDTNENGGERAFVMTGEYENVLPMDIYPVYLLKAILAGDIDKMENLGIYEVIEEDLALCEFVCTSKILVQKIVRDGINLMIKELS